MLEMAFSSERIQEVIEEALRRKIDSYNPEPSYKPFHENLFGKDKMALFSFIQSLNTTMGTSIYEPVAKEIATGVFESVETQHKLSGTFTNAVQQEINEIVNELSHGTIEPDHSKELQRIRSKCRVGETVNKRLTVVDLYLKNGNNHFPIDIKTAKPNISGFEKQKQIMLEWMGSILYENPEANVRPITGIPYNPYHPESYVRWTLRKSIDTSSTNSQLLVAEQFWSFLAGGEEIFERLIECFEFVGTYMRWEIDRFQAECIESDQNRSY